MADRLLGCEHWAEGGAAGRRAGCGKAEHWRGAAWRQACCGLTLWRRPSGADGCVCGCDCAVWLRTVLHVASFVGWAATGWRLPLRAAWRPRSGVTTLAHSPQPTPTHRKGGAIAVSLLLGRLRQRRREQLGRSAVSTPRWRRVDRRWGRAAEAPLARRDEAAWPGGHTVGFGRSGQRGTSGCNIFR